MRILLVDYDSKMAELARRGLPAEGYRVEIAPDGSFGAFGYAASAASRLIHTVRGFGYGLREGGGE